MGEQDFQVSQKSGEAVDVCSITKRLTNRKHKAGEMDLFLQLFSPSHTSSISVGNRFLKPQ